MTAPRRPTLVELEALRATLESGGTHAAARRLGRAASSISRALAQLEDRLGTTLFERHGRGLVPTEDAHRLNASLSAVFATLDQLGGTMPATAGAPDRLIVAAPSPFALSLLPRAARLFRQTHPNVVIELAVADTDDVVGRVSEGRADMGLTDGRPHHSGIALTAFRHSRAACLLPADHRLARYSRLQTHQFTDVDFISLTKRHTARFRLDALFRQAGIERRIVFETSTASAGLAAVAQGIGVALLNPFPLLTHGEALPRGVIMRPFDPALDYRSMLILPQGGPRGRAVRAMIQAIRLAAGPADAWSDPIAGQPRK